MTGKPVNEIHQVRGIDVLISNQQAPACYRLIYSNSLILLDGWFVLGRHALEVVDGLFWCFDRKATRTGTRLALGFNVEELDRGVCLLYHGWFEAYC